MQSVLRVACYFRGPQRRIGSQSFLLALGGVVLIGISLLECATLHAQSRLTSTIASGGIADVSLDTTGAHVWYAQRETPTGWFSSPTAVAIWPLLSLPEDQQLQATGPEGAAYSFPVTAEDSEGPLPASCSPVSGSGFPFGTTRVTCSTSTAAGTATASFYVTVVDTTPPVITVPADMVAEATGPAGAPITYSVTASDTVDGKITPGCSRASGANFPIGSTTVECTAVDSHGNAAHATFAVTVRDTTPPVLASLPPNITTEAASVAGAVVTYTAPTAHDLVDGAVPVACTPSSGATFSVGITTVTCIASDVHGNESRGAFTVTVTRVPAIAKVAPASGPAGSVKAVTITGSKLATISSVHFGALAAVSFEAKSDTTIVALAPAAGPSVVDIVLSGPGGTSATSAKDRYKYAPIITTLTPSSAPAAGGSTVSVGGSGFLVGGSATVFKFGTTKSPHVICSTTISCTVQVPARALGTVDVTAIANRVTSPKSEADRFTYR